jgi:hypothetical protein
VAAQGWHIEKVAGYLAARAAPAFVRFIESTSPELLDRALADIPEPEAGDASARLAVRLASYHPDLFDQRRVRIVEAALQAAADEYGWLGFLDVTGFERALPAFSSRMIQREIDGGFPSIELLYDWHAQDLSSKQHVEGAMGAIESHCERLSEEFSKDASKLSALASAREFVDSRLAERLGEIEDDENQRGDYFHDEWKERYYAGKYELENGRFADVDE